MKQLKIVLYTIGEIMAIVNFITSYAYENSLAMSGWACSAILWFTLVLPLLDQKTERKEQP